MSSGQDNPAFRALAEHLDEACWLFSADGNEILYANPAFERIWPRPHPDHSGSPRGWLDALHPEDRPRVAHSFAGFLAAPAGTGYNEHYRLLRSDGDTRWIHQRIIPFTQPAGTPRRHLSLASDVTDLRLLQGMLHESNDKLLRLSRQRETVNEAQRSRIARDIHDEFGQALTVLNLDLHWLAGHHARDEQTRDRLDRMRELVGRMAQSVQDITLRLRPADLGACGLEGALDGCISRFRRQHEDLVCRQSVALGGVEIDQDSAIALYRILQEALTNISRHAHAGRVTIDVFEDGADICLVVEDDGAGIGARDLDRGDAWGLIGMRERVDALRGRLDISSTPGRGTRIAARLPRTVPGVADDALRQDTLR